MSERHCVLYDAERIKQSRYDWISFIPLMIVHEPEEEERVERRGDIDEYG